MESLYDRDRVLTDALRDYFPPEITGLVRDFRGYRVGNVDSATAGTAAVQSLSFNCTGELLVFSYNVPRTAAAFAKLYDVRVSHEPLYMHSHGVGTHFLIMHDAEGITDFTHEAPHGAVVHNIDYVGFDDTNPALLYISDWDRPGMHRVPVADLDYNSHYATHWPVARGVNSFTFQPGSDFAYYLTDEGELWRLCTTHPLPMHEFGGYNLRRRVRQLGPYMGGAHHTGQTFDSSNKLSVNRFGAIMGTLSCSRQVWFFRNVHELDRGQRPTQAWIGIPPADPDMSDYCGATSAWLPYSPTVGIWFAGADGQAFEFDIRLPNITAIMPSATYPGGPDFIPSVSKPVYDPAKPQYVLLGTSLWDRRNWSKPITSVVPTLQESAGGHRPHWYHSTMTRNLRGECLIATGSCRTGPELWDVTSKVGAA